MLFVIYTATYFGLLKLVRMAAEADARERTNRELARLEAKRLKNARK